MPKIDLLSVSVISIPVILLRMAQLQCDHKMRMAAVLCLSFTCIILSAARLAGGIHRNIKGILQFGTVWISFMLHCEAAIAVITGSVPAIRAIYKTHQRRRTIYASTTQLKDLENSAGTVAKSQIEDNVSAPPKTYVRLSPEPPQRSGSRASRLRHSLTKYQIPPIRGIRLHSRNNSQQLSRSASSASFLPPEQCEGNGPPNEIHVTYECTIVSEEASLHDLPDFSEVGRQEWVCEGPSREEEGSSSGSMSTFMHYKDMDIDPSLLGKINSGLMM
jgi:hypothetical protein